MRCVSTRLQLSGNSDYPHLDKAKPVQIKKHKYRTRCPTQKARSTQARILRIPVHLKDYQAQNTSTGGSHLIRTRFI